MADHPLRPGAVFWAAPDAVVGRPQRGRRPFVAVASPGYLSQVTTLVLAVPLTTADRSWPNHVLVAGPGTGLEVTCFAMTEQIRALSRDRIQAVVGVVDEPTRRAIRMWVSDFLDLGGD